jgi:hypothetical protein
MESMSIPTESVARPMGGPAVAASAPPKSSVASHPALTGEPLAVAYEKRVQTLQDSLKERDQVVQMLTQRLEQAADQLDRLQRTGGGRGTAVASGVPPELIENQQQMSEQMSQLLEQWEELQATQMLTRIESRLTDLHDLVASGAAAPISISAVAAVNTKAASISPPKASAGASVLNDVRAAEPAKTGWEAIKAAMLAGENYSTTAATSPTPPPTQAPTSETTATEPLSSESSVELDRSTPQPLPDPPPAIDFDVADQETLIDAIRCRDEFISILLRRLSSPDASTEFPDWEKLNFVPEDLHRELLGLRDRLQEKLRVAEVDLSLQRAKLAREEAKLALKAEQVVRHARQVGLASDDAASQGSQSAALKEGSNATQGRRWLQFLQRSNGNGSATDAK